MSSRLLAEIKRHLRPDGSDIDRPADARQLGNLPREEPAPVAVFRRQPLPDIGGHLVNDAGLPVQVAVIDR